VTSPMAHGARETEIKLAVPDVRTARGLLRSAGFRVSKRRVFETNTVFDTPELSLRRAATLLRVRQAGGAATLTYKGPPDIGRHKSREELELDISDVRAMSAIIERLGLGPVFRYEKYRTEYRQPGHLGIATLDETPVGVYLELEGTPTWIDRAARKLGFADEDYITSSYARLWLDWCEWRGVKPTDMLFKESSQPLRRS
jgi:adenylate cyclase, class 2